MKIAFSETAAVENDLLTRGVMKKRTPKEVWDAIRRQELRALLEGIKALAEKGK